VAKVWVLKRPGHVGPVLNCASVGRTAPGVRSFLRPRRVRKCRMGFHWSQCFVRWAVRRQRRRWGRARIVRPCHHRPGREADQSVETRRRKNTAPQVRTLALELWTLIRPRRLFGSNDQVPTPCSSAQAYSPTIGEVHGAETDKSSARAFLASDAGRQPVRVPSTSWTTTGRLGWFSDVQGPAHGTCDGLMEVSASAKGGISLRNTSTLPAQARSTCSSPRRGARVQETGFRPGAGDGGFFGSKARKTCCLTGTLRAVYGDDHCSYPAVPRLCLGG